MHILLGLVIIIIGVVNVASPETGWHLSHGWQFKDAEPSDEALRWGRIAGIFTIVLGVLLCFGLISLS